MIWRGQPLGFDRDTGEAISYEGSAPVQCYGPPGSFKSVGLVCTALLDDDSGKRSYLVLGDAKLEIAAITSRFRRTVGDVKIINQYGLLTDRRPDLKSDGWNPLDDLNPDLPGFVDECAARGDALIKTNANESQPIFPNSARSALTAAINFEVRSARLLGETPSLPAVRAMLTLDAERLKELVDEMIATGDADIVTRMRKFKNDNREIQSILSNIDTDTSWMTPEMRADMVVKGGVDFRALKERCTTIYVGIPTAEMLNKAPYLRLLLSTALRHLYRHDGLPVTVLVDEAFILGHLTELENACSILRGYDSRLVSMWQSAGQARKNYPDTFELFGLGAMLCFRPGDMQTAELMVKKAGKVTLPVLSASDPSSANDAGVRPSWQQRERDRIPLHKMFEMPQGKALVFPPHQAPRVVRVKGYFEIPELNRRADANPYHRGNGSTVGKASVAGIGAGGIAAGVVMLLFVMSLLGMM